MPNYQENKKKTLLRQKQKRFFLLTIGSVLVVSLIVGFIFWSSSQKKNQAIRMSCPDNICQYDWIYLENANKFDKDQASIIVSQLNVYRKRFGCYQKTIKIVPTDLTNTHTNATSQSEWEPGKAEAGVINLDLHVTLVQLRYIIAHEAGHACRSGIIVPLKEPVINQFGEIYAIDGFTLLIKVPPKGIQKYPTIEEAYVDRNASCIPGYDVNSAVYWPMTQKFLQWFPCDDLEKEQKLIEWYRTADIWSLTKEFYDGKVETVTLDNVFGTMDWLERK